MEAAQERMQLLDAGDLLRLSNSVENAGVAARGDDDETAILHVKAGRVLVRMLIRDDLALQLCRREMGVLGGVAPETILDPVLPHGVGQYLLEAGGLDLPGGEGVAGDHGRVFAQDGRDSLRRQRAPVESAEVGQLAGCPDEAMAESVLPAGVEFHVCR